MQRCHGSFFFPPSQDHITEDLLIRPTVFTMAGDSYCGCMSYEMCKISNRVTLSQAVTSVKTNNSSRRTQFLKQKPRAAILEKLAMLSHPTNESSTQPVGWKRFPKSQKKIPEKNYLFMWRNDVPGSINQHVTWGRKCSIFISFKQWGGGPLRRKNQFPRHHSSLATLTWTRILVHGKVTSWLLAGQQGDWELRACFSFFVPGRLPQQRWKRQAMPVYGFIDPFLVASFLPW